MNDAPPCHSFLFIDAHAVQPFGLALEGGNECLALEINVAGFKVVDELMNVDRFIRFADCQVGFRQILQYINLHQIMRTFVNVADVHSTAERVSREIRPADAQLRGAQTAKRIDEVAVKAVLDSLDYADGGREVKNGRVVFLVFLLHKTEVGQRLCRFVAVQAVKANRELDHSFCQRVGFTEAAGSDCRLIQVKVAAKLFQVGFIFRELRRQNLFVADILGNVFAAGFPQVID